MITDVLQLARVYGAGVPVVHDGLLQPPARSTDTIHRQRVGVRFIQAREPAGRLPEHVRQVSGLRYGCLWRTTAPSSVVDTSSGINFRVADRGNGWLLLDGVERGRSSTS